MGAAEFMAIRVAQQQYQMATYGCTYSAGQVFVSRLYKAFRDGK